MFSFVYHIKATRVDFAVIIYYIAAVISTDKRSIVMDKIKLKRGDSEVTLKKVPDVFAVRLKQGRARDEKALISSCGITKAEVQHIDAAAPAKMDIFSVKDASLLEGTMDQLRQANSSDVITHTYSLDDDSSSAVIPTGTMTLQFQQDVSKVTREDILAEFGLEILEELDFLPHGYTVRLTSASTMNPLKIALKLQGLEDIKTAEPDLSFQVELKHVPEDNIYADQWHLKNPGGLVGLKEGADVSAEQAWEIARGSRDITICVIDDGFDLNHPDFNATGKIVTPRDFGQGDFLPNPVFEDDNHGTACAGVACAEENGSGVVGLAPGCSFMPVRMGPWLTDQSIVDLFQYAINNAADVVSCSWSAGAWNFPLSTKMNAIIHKAATQGRSNNKGLVILFAAGNEDRPLKGEKDAKISHQGFALHPDVIAVAASNSLDQRAYYSNYGPEITICAPSSGSPGRGVVTTDRRGTQGYSSNDYTYSFGGTSSATPLTAGLAGLILSANKELSSAEVRDIIMQTADKIQPDTGNYVDGHSDLFGHGRINAEKAVAMAAGVADAPRLPAVLYMEHRVSKPIPDMDQTHDSIIFPLDVTVQQIEVSLDIKHTWRGDLQVFLLPPGGGEITLIDRSGGSRDDILVSFRSSDEPSLFASVLGNTAKGDWRLRIVDTANQDVGILQKWGLAITY